MRVGRSVVSVAMSVPLSLSAWAGPADPWVIDRQQSSISFTAKQMGSPLIGRFERFAGEIRLDPSDLANARIRIEIETASAATGTKDVDSELPKPEWFAAARFPRSVFEATEVKALGGDRYEARGRLTLRDVTRDVVLPFALTFGEDARRSGQLLAKASGRIEIRRNDYGVGQGDWKATTVVADEVAIVVTIVAERPK